MLTVRKESVNFSSARESFGNALKYGAIYAFSQNMISLQLTCLTQENLTLKKLLVKI